MGPVLDTKSMENAVSRSGGKLEMSFGNTSDNLSLMVYP